MGMASLAKTNKFLATAEQRAKIVRASVATSSAIEGIYAPFMASSKAPNAKGKPAATKAVKNSKNRAATKKGER